MFFLSIFDKFRGRFVIRQLHEPQRLTFYHNTLSNEIKILLKPDYQTIMAGLRNRSEHALFGLEFIHNPKK